MGEDKNHLMLAVLFLIICANPSFSEDVTEPTIDPHLRDHITIEPEKNTCPSERTGVVNYLDITDCKGFPCIIHREKRYYATFSFSPKLDTKFMRIKCGTTYLGRPHTVRNINVCEHMTEEQSCPLVAGQNYSYTTTFKVPYFVPPTSYLIACQLADDSGMDTMCGTGVAKVV